MNSSGQIRVRAQILQKAATDSCFKNDLLHNPKSAIEKELGTPLPEGITIHVLEEKQNEYFLILPLNPESGRDGLLNDQQLESVAGGSCYRDTIIQCPMWG